ncbi:mgtA regulatory leader peptide MgtL [Klebsiella sp. RIT-PI-d]
MDPDPTPLPRRRAITIR